MRLAETLKRYQKFTKSGFLELQLDEIDLGLLTFNLKCDILQPFIQGNNN